MSPSSRPFTAVISFLLFIGQSEMVSASAVALAGSALRAEVTSTQSSAERW